jgi:hypothetical protein
MASRLHLCEDPISDEIDALFGWCVSAGESLVAERVFRTEGRVGSACMLGNVVGVLRVRILSR